MKQWLIEAFAYDEWANRTWADVLRLPTSALVPVRGPGPWPDFPAVDVGARLEAVFTHILWAERIWLARCGEQVSPPQDAGAHTWISELHDGWIRAIEERDPEERIDYRNTAGREGNLSFGDIARHVVTHSTYHRGQLREILGSIRPHDIPETGTMGCPPG